MIEELSIMPLYAWIIIAVILLVQGSWIFNDANKRGMNKWVWGLFGLLNCPSNLIVYLIVSRAVFGANRCGHCGKRFNNNFSYCPYCGVANKRVIEADKEIL